ncbi:hypothetical protein PENTCL1PPCAC_1779, partial [Pristionchus entomophagus]
QIFSAILIALLVSISLQREYHNGMQRWNQNCNVCKSLINVVHEIYTGRRGNRTEITDNLFIGLCDSLGGRETELCKELLELKYFSEPVSYVYRGNLYIVDGVLDSEGLCRDKKLKLCPPTDKRSMYDTPEFPLLRLPEQVKKDFNNVVRSMNRPEFD